MTMKPPIAQRGFAIILVLWLLVLFASIGMHLTARSRTELQIARNVEAATGAEALADGGVARAVHALSNPDPTQRWPLGGQPHDVTIGDGRVRIIVRDENTKINPNLAPEPLMAALLRQVGIEQNRALDFATVIARRVRLTAFTANSSAEQTPMPFDSIDDMLILPGVTKELIAALRPHTSVYASAPIPAAGTADKIVAAAVADFHARNRGDTRSVANPPASPDRVTVSILAEARNPAGAVFARDAVVRLDAMVPKGYVVLRWGRSDATAP